MANDPYAKEAAEAVNFLNMMSGCVYQSFTEQERKGAFGRVCTVASMLVAVTPAVRIAARTAHPMLNGDECVGLVMESVLRALAGSFGLDAEAVVERARRAHLGDFKPPRDPGVN
jgi:hypothetical protein